VLVVALLVSSAAGGQPSPKMPKASTAVKSKIFFILGLSPVFFKVVFILLN
jgi:hypothetical protein